MNFHPHGVPPDDPNIEIYEHAHSIDHEIDSTNLAISIHRAAVAAGHPGNPDAARTAMTGPAAAAAVQAAMDPFVEEAVRLDEDATQHAGQALDLASHAQTQADQRSRLPHEQVPLADGSSQTRGQVQTGHARRMEVAAQRIGRGDAEHLERQPGAGTRLLVAIVLSSIELGLLIWPVTDASWNDLLSVGYVAGLAVMFLLMNDLLPNHAGRAWREYREMRHAARELTLLAVSTGRAGDLERGREIAGQVDGRHLKEIRRRALGWGGMLGGVLVVYGAVMFTRVLRLAEPLGSPLFSVLAATLVTLFTAGVPIVMAYRWSRGNLLGDELREHGTITAESREIAQHLHDEAEAAIATAEQISELARDQLESANQRIHDGYRLVTIGLQKAARMLGLDSVLTPNPQNLLPGERMLGARALDTLTRTATVIAGVRQALADPGPFAPDGPAPNPWHHRAAPRRAIPDLAHLDPSQTGALHQPPK